MQRISNLLIVLLFTTGLKAQEVNKVKDYYHYPNGDTVFITTYIIKNTPKSELFMWFDIDGKQRSQVEYFLTKKEDYSLLSILNDDEFDNKRFDIINLSFIKKINKNNCFTISVSYSRKEDWERNLFDDKIVFVKPNELRPAIRSALTRTDECYYKSDYISLSFDSLKVGNMKNENQSLK
ncbi:hypothetical protein D3H65_04255 [Paraflavitalea soli]|uniref:Uncharacterized protein n=1 Tax=Paraflavitalea soli TaxID=2315862 RepID=A0A3B7MFX2_9BACT|nr:hypothetical protein [Paraflavitalea soli]AXY73234.1 hypothetical protein D3H65_04255 [Paraflavitalea soli]